MFLTLRGCFRLPGGQVINSFLALFLIRVSVTLTQLIFLAHYRRDFRRGRFNSG
jgi:hypothetical protein